LKIEEVEEEKSSLVVALTEPEAEESTLVAVQEEKQSKYMLLDRLMKFVRSKEQPLNAVLAGYFSKLLTLLINRK
jgi:hypothetical protein